IILTTISLVGGFWPIRMDVHPCRDWRRRCLAVLERQRTVHSAGGVALFLDDAATAAEAGNWLTGILPLMDEGSYHAMDRRSRLALVHSLARCDPAKDAAYII